jgi:ABC-type multidrug transport system ATPase subunit
MLCCLISKTSGKASIGGYDIARKTDHQKIRRMIGLLTENVGLYEELSAYDNLDFYGRFYRLDEQKRRARALMTHRFSFWMSQLQALIRKLLRRLETSSSS